MLSFSRLLSGIPLSLNQFYRMSSTSFLPSLPKNVISPFGLQLKSSIEDSVFKLIEEAAALDGTRENAFQQVGFRFYID